jgi:hypothetical protein
MSATAAPPPREAESDQLSARGRTATTPGGFPSCHSGSRARQRQSDLAGLQLRRFNHTLKQSSAEPDDVVAVYPNMLTDGPTNHVVSEFVRGKIRSIVKNPEVAEALVPWLPIGCKRTCYSTCQRRALARCAALWPWWSLRCAGRGRVPTAHRPPPAGIRCREGDMS